MKEFFWKYFYRTGNVDAYMLYKEQGTDLENEEELLEEQADGGEVDTL